MKILLISLLATLLLSGCSNENETHEKITTESRTEHREGDEYGHDKKVEDEHGDGHKGDGYEEEAGIVKLSPQQLQTPGIKITPIELREVGAMIRAPGEVKLNAYQTVKVTSAIAAQVVARLAHLGDNVE